MSNCGLSKSYRNIAFSHITWLFINYENRRNDKRAGGELEFSNIENFFLTFLWVQNWVHRGCLYFRFWRVFWAVDTRQYPSVTNVTFYLE